MKYLLFLIVMLSQIAFGQTLISYELIDEVSTAQAATEYGVDNPQFAQKVYKVLYLTEHITTQLDTASGLVCLPIESGRTFPQLVYQHGTANSREDVPSRDVESSIGKIMAALGYASALPDYIGLGDSKGIHPYIHSASEASAGADLLIAMREVSIQEDVVLNDQVFLTGYSQGGHASAALQRDIEAGRFEGLSTVTAASHLSGPYSISERMPEFTLGDMPYQAVAYLPWVVLSLQFTYPDLMEPFALDDIFKSEFIDPIEKFRDEEINLFSMNIALIGTLFSGSNTQILPKLMLREDILDSLLNDPEHPINQALARNDLIDWVPQAPTRLMGCAGDDQVTYENSLYAASVMNANGAVDLEAQEYGPESNHGQCVAPVVEATIDFFSQYQEIGFFLDTDESTLDSCTPQIIQLDGRVSLAFTPECQSDINVQVIDLTGKVVQSHQVNTLEMDISLASMQSGMYIISVQADDGSVYNHKIVR